MLTQINNNIFNPKNPNHYHNLINSLINFNNHYQILTNYHNYINYQNKINKLYKLQKK